MFDYNKNAIREDIKKYLEAGCCELSYTPGYLEDANKIIDHDKEILYGLLNDGNNRTLFVDVAKFIDRKKTTREKRVFLDEEFMSMAETSLGEDAEEYLWKLGIRCEDDKGLFYGEVMHKLGRNGSAGLCLAFYPDKSERNDQVILYGSNENMPEEMLLTFYHESAHALQKRFAPEVGDKDFDMVWEFQRKGIKRDSDGAIAKKFERMLGYLSYLKETHAETFASAVLLLKSKDENEFENVSLRVMENARNKMVGGLGRGKKAFYNFYPMACSLVRHLKQLGGEGREKFFDQKGNLDFLKINRYTAEVVKKKAYSKDEFWNYQEFDRTRDLAEVENNPSCRRWVAEYNEVKEYQKTEVYDACRYLDALFIVMKKSFDKKEVYLLLTKGGKKNDDLKEMFLKHNSLLPIETKYYQRKNDMGR